MVGDTLAEMYERMMARVEQITRAGYQVELHWECEIKDGRILGHHPELHTQPVVKHTPLNTREALYGGQTEAIWLH